MCKVSASRSAYSARHAVSPELNPSTGNAPRVYRRMSSSRGFPRLLLTAQRRPMVTSRRNKWMAWHTHMFSDCSLLFGQRCSPLFCVFGHFVSFRNSRRVAPFHSGKRYRPGNSLSVICPATSLPHKVSFNQSLSAWRYPLYKDAAKMQ